MSEFKTGDNVLVTLGGVDVPAIVSYAWFDIVDIEVSDVDDTIGVPVGTVRLDPSKKGWAVGDVVKTAEELATLPDNTVFVDVNYFVQEWDDFVWRFGSKEDLTPEGVDYPVTVIYLSKDV